MYHSAHLLIIVAQIDKMFYHSILFYILFLNNNIHYVQHTVLSHRLTTQTICS